MAHYILLCTIDETKLELFAQARAQHYGFLIAQRDRILFGGPARVPEGGRPEIMIIVVEAGSLAEAEEFIVAEPYNQYGGFSNVVIRPWSQVLPEQEDGELQKVFDAESAKGESQR